MEGIKKPDEDDRLQKIKFLVDQSRLYSQFLASSLQDLPPRSKDENVIEDVEEEEEEAIKHSAKSNRPSKRAKRGDREASIKSRKTSDGSKPISKDQPRSVIVPLHAHQISALKWQIMLYQNGLNGILADEMGLGKTLEVISFLAFLIENEVKGPFLVVAPLSTIGNWRSEIERFAPSISHTKYHGTKDARRTIAKKWTDAQIILTSYEIAIADQKFLQRFDWKYVIVDEGHRLKNVNSKLVRVLKTFKSANRMLLTGTPLQNNLTELWALLNFLLPDVFTDLEIFHQWFESGEFEIGDGDESGLVTSLHDILRPFLLRRLKKDVGLKLPPKREYVVFTGLSTPQQELYKALLDGTAREYVVEQILAESQGDSKDRALLVKQAQQELRKKSFSNLVMQLRLCCNSPHLFWYPQSLDQIQSASGKFQLLERLMLQLKSTGHKVLIFTQFTRMLDILEDWAEVHSYKYFRLDGSTSQEAREEMLNRFSESESDIDIFILTTRSGGQGVNLVGADTVIIFDSDWNPQQDLQAMDRVHRIGQEKPVLVIRLCTGDTVEQDLLARAASKLELNQLVIEKGQFKEPALISGITNEDKINVMDQQLQQHRLNFAKGATVNISDEDIAKMLDRSPEAYESSLENPSISESIHCVKNDL